MNGVKKECDAPEVCSAAGEYGNDAAVDDALVESFNRFFLCDFGCFKEFVKEFFACLRKSFVERVCVSGSYVFVVGVERSVSSLAACVECVCFAGDKVEELNVLAVLYGNEKRADSRAELFVKLVKYFFKVCVRVVALVYEESAGNLISDVPLEELSAFSQNKVADGR